jgi:5-methylcytosine-specific restriction enzyme A
MNRLTGRRLQTRRELHRDRNPWCVECLKDGQYVPWTELDHLIALTNGGEDTDENLQGLCSTCHDIKTRRDMGWKTSSACDANGHPVDPNHHWNRRGGGG